MSDLGSFLPEGGWSRFALDVLWQSSLVGLVAYGALRPLVCQPAARAWLLLLALAGCAVLPVASALARAGGYGWWSRSTVDLAVASADEAVAPLEPATILRPITPPPIAKEVVPIAETALPPIEPVAVEKHRPASGVSVPWPVVLGGLWAMASGLLLGHPLLSAYRVLQLARAAVACCIQRILAAAAAAAEQVGLRQTPRVAHSDSVTAPMVLAFCRPRLLIPSADAHPDTKTDWFPIFCHELAHVRRGDAWGSLLARVILVLIPWQPLVWWLRREYRRACEQACDDWAVSAGADPIQFASLLTQWIRRKTPAPALGAIGASSIRPRIERLLAHRSAPRPRAGLLWRLGTTAAALLILVTVAMAQTGKPRPPEHRDHEPKRPSRQTRQETRKEALRRTGLAPYRLAPPDVLSIEVELTRASGVPPVTGEYSIGPDGAVNLKQYGSVRVAALTIDQAKAAVEEHLGQYFDSPDASLSVLHYKSKVYYVITEGAVKGDGITRVPITGKEKVLDAIRLVGGPSNLSGKKIWIARPAASGLGEGQILPVDWKAISSGRSNKTNHLLLPDDRVFVAPRRQVNLSAVARNLYGPPGEMMLHATAALGEQLARRLDSPAASGDAVPEATPTLQPPRETRMQSFPAYQIEPPDVLLIELPRAAGIQPIEGGFLVGPDGTVNLRKYGSVQVAALTIDQAKAAVDKHLRKYFDSPDASVSVLNYNSKVYYVIIEGDNKGDHIVRVMITGKETVLDAISNIDGLSNLSGKKIWIARPAAGGFGEEQILPVDWEAVTRGADTATNYQIFPDDRVFVAGKAKSPGRSVPVDSGQQSQRTKPNEPTYCVIVQDKNNKAKVTHVPWTGKQTLRDAIAEAVGDLVQLSGKYVWIYRRDGEGYTIQGQGYTIREMRFVPDIHKLTQGAIDLQLKPGDRLFIANPPHAQNWVKELAERDFR